MSINVGVLVLYSEEEMGILELPPRTRMQNAHHITNQLALSISGPLALKSQ